MTRWRAIATRVRVSVGGEWLLLREAHAEWRQGRAHGFPLCCNLRYCLDFWLGRQPATLRTGCWCRGFVPCGLFHNVDRACLDCSVRSEVLPPQMVQP